MEMMRFALFHPEVFEWNEKHPKAFAMFFPQVLVMHFMRPTDGTRVPVVNIAQNFESLVDKDIVYYEIRESVAEDSDAYGESELKNAESPQQT